VPLQQQGRTTGVLFLDNTRVAGAFTGERVEVLRILAAQAAIALENARLVTGLKQEIDERRVAQDRLAGALAEVERLKQDLEAENSYLRRDLIANVSHDLRTPLVSIRGYLEVLAAKGDQLAPPQRRDYLAIAVRQSEHLGRLVDQLFELAKLDFKDMTLSREAFPLGELAHDVIQKFRLVAEGRGVHLEVEAPAALANVDGDLGLLERVFENLIGNALRYTPAGGSVTVRLTGGEDAVQVEVADTGSGIAAAELPKVFDRHWRGGDGCQTASTGAGLGLAITKRILELHGAPIGVESGDHGTRFSFAVPTALAQNRRMSTPARRSVATGPGLEPTAVRRAPRS
jgi:signal transduction histidine kinase